MRSEAPFSRYDVAVKEGRFPFWNDLPKPIYLYDSQRAFNSKKYKKYLDGARLLSRYALLTALCSGAASAVIADLLYAPNSAAATIDTAEAMALIPPPSLPSLSMHSLIPVPSTAPIIPGGMCPIRQIPGHIALHHTHSHHAHRVHHPNKYAHLKNDRRYLPPPPVELNKVTITVLPKQYVTHNAVLPPPSFVACGDNGCDFPCDGSDKDQNLIDLKGPCADPNIRCVERVSFNTDGEAIRVVLEPQKTGQSSPHYETYSQNSKSTDWKTAAPNITRHDASNELKTSLVIPFVRETSSVG